MSFVFKEHGKGRRWSLWLSAGLQQRHVHILCNTGPKSTAVRGAQAGPRCLQKISISTHKNSFLGPGPTMLQLKCQLHDFRSWSTPHPPHWWAGTENEVVCSELGCAHQTNSTRTIWSTSSRETGAVCSPAAHSSLWTTWGATTRSLWKPDTCTALRRPQSQKYSQGTWSGVQEKPMCNTYQKLPGFSNSFSTGEYLEKSSGFWRRVLVLIKCSLNTKLLAWNMASFYAAHVCLCGTTEDLIEADHSSSDWRQGRTDSAGLFLI